MRFWLAIALAGCGGAGGPGDADDATRDATDASDASDASDSAEVDATRNSWAQVVAGYGLLETVAGQGGVRDEGNEWLPAFEGGPATAAELSRPHVAMADHDGRIFIADKEAHAVRRVETDGMIVTVAGTGVPGDDGDMPGPAVSKRLTDPNGLFVLASGVAHILDQGNGKVRRLAQDGTLTTFITVPGGIASGRGLWVAEDESAAFIAAGDRVLRWTAASGVAIYADGFGELGNLAVDPGGALVVTDRLRHRVFRVAPDGTKDAIAGNGSITGGGDGQPALASGLEEPRAVWFLDEGFAGGYFVGTHEGNQVWYVDPDGVLHLFLDGGDGHAHAGDGQHFRTPGQKVSEVRAVTVTPTGDVLITENDYGYVRRVVRRR